MKKTNKISSLLLGATLLLTIACDNDLDQLPDNIITTENVPTFGEVLNAGYFYHRNMVSPMGVISDFRSDNALMDEEPFPAFDRFTGVELNVHEIQFFQPLYADGYQAIVSANIVIENVSGNASAQQIGEARFIRALAYFKLVQVFGDVPINLLATVDTSDASSFVRQPVADVYNNVIIPDLLAAIPALDNSAIPARASWLAAQALLGKVYVHTGDFVSAETRLATVVNSAAVAGVSLEANFADIFDEVNELGSELIFVSQVDSSVPDEYPGSEFFEWYSGGDSKSDMPLDPDLIAAFDTSEANGGGTDLRKTVTIDEVGMTSPKYNNSTANNQDWIEIRLADVMLLYAEALNENGSTSAALSALNTVRARAGLTALTTITSQAIQDERRLELAFEGKRWYDLVRTGTVDAEMGQTIDSNLHLFPIPTSEVFTTNGVTTQNPGY